MRVVVALLGSVRTATFSKRSTTHSQVKRLRRQDHPSALVILLISASLANIYFDVVSCWISLKLIEAWDPTMGQSTHSSRSLCSRQLSNLPIAFY